MACYEFINTSHIEQISYAAEQVCVLYTIVVWLYVSCGA